MVLAIIMHFQGSFIHASDSRVRHASLPQISHEIRQSSMVTGQENSPVKLFPKR